MSYKKFQDLTHIENIESKRKYYPLYGYLIEDPNLSKTVMIIKNIDNIIFLSDIENLIKRFNTLKTNLIENYLFGDNYTNMDEIIKIQELLVLLHEQYIIPEDENKISIINYNKLKSVFDISNIKDLKNIINLYLEKENKTFINILKILTEIIKISTDKTKISFIFKDLNSNEKDIILEPIIIKPLNIFEKIYYQIISCFRKNNLTIIQSVYKNSSNPVLGKTNTYDDIA